MRMVIEVRSMKMSKPDSLFRELIYIRCFYIATITAEICITHVVSHYQ